MRSICVIRNEKLFIEMHDYHKKKFAFHTSTTTLTLWFCIMKGRASAGSSGTPVSPPSMLRLLEPLLLCLSTRLGSESKGSLGICCIMHALAISTILSLMQSNRIRSKGLTFGGLSVF